MAYRAQESSSVIALRSRGRKIVRLSLRLLGPGHSPQSEHPEQEIVDSQIVTGSQLSFANDTARGFDSPFAMGDVQRF